MKMRSYFLVGVVTGGLLSGAAAAPAAAIFDVNFNGDGINSMPTTEQATGNPPYDHPVSTNVEGDTTILVQNAASASAFDSFGDGNFIVFTKKQKTIDGKNKQNGTMNFSLPSAHQPDSGTAIFTFQYQRNESQSEQSTGNFALYLYSTEQIDAGKVIGELTVTLADNRLHVYRNTGSGPVADSPTNLTTLSPGVEHTIQAVLRLNGDASTLDFYVDSIRLETPAASTVHLGSGGKLQIGQLRIANGDGGTVAVDNVSIAVPEPSTLGLLGLVGPLMLTRRRK